METQVKGLMELLVRTILNKKKLTNTFQMIRKRKVKLETQNHPNNSASRLPELQTPNEKEPQES
jgi:hypothetical protein